MVLFQPLLCTPSPQQLSGTFIITAGGVPTSPLLFNITDAALQAALSALPAVGAVAVSRTGPNTQRGYVWSITYLAMTGNVPEPTVDFTGLSGTGKSATLVQVAGGTVQEVQTVLLTALNGGTTPLSGNITLTHTGHLVQQTTPLIPVTDCATLQPAVQAALQALTNLGNVAVACTGSPAASLSLAITYLNNPGTFQLLAVDTTVAVGLAVGAAGLSVTRTVTGTSVELGGKFVLDFQGQRTGYMDVLATGALVESELIGLSTVGNMTACCGVVCAVVCWCGGGVWGVWVGGGVVGVVGGVVVPVCVVE
jgi:hypothetical protein